MRILFSDEKMIDLNGIYNSQNDIIWTVNRAEADDKSDIKHRKISRESNDLVRCLLKKCNAMTKEL